MLSGCVLSTAVHITCVLVAFNAEASAAGVTEGYWIDMLAFVCHVHTNSRYLLPPKMIQSLAWQPLPFPFSIEQLF